MPNANRRYSYGFGPTVSRRTLYRRRKAESRRVERLNQVQWKNKLDAALMSMQSSLSTNCTTHDADITEDQAYSAAISVDAASASLCMEFDCSAGESTEQVNSCSGGDRTDQGNNCSGGDRTDQGSGWSGGEKSGPRVSSEGGRRDISSSSEEDSNLESPVDEPTLAASSDNQSGSDGDEPGEPYLPEHHDNPPLHGSHDSDACDASLLRRLCECTNATIGEAIAMVMTLGVRHSLTWAGMVDILRLINVLFDKRVVPDTKYLFFKHVDPSANYKLDRHVYCAHCHRYFGKEDKEEEDHQFECQCKPEKQLSSFMTIGLRKQLQDLLKRKDIQEALQYGFQARQHETEDLADIFDGKVYKSFCLPGGLLHNSCNLSVSFFTDGVSMGKSSKRSVWPIYIVLNELPPRLRFKHMMLAGIWVGPKDPNMFVFLHAFIDDVNSLSEEGVTWSHGGTPTTSKVIPTSVCVDSPARCKVLNMKQFHGKDSCGFCYHKGCRVRGVIGYRYTVAGDLPALRTDSELRYDMTEVHRRIQLNYPLKRQVVRGVRGPSALMDLNHFNLTTMIVPDLMHLFKLVQTMLFMYLDSSRSTHLNDAQVCKISSRLESFRLPSSISRSTRPLSQLKLYKCNELRNYLLLFGVVAMKGILCDQYVAHFSLLSSAIRLLVNKSVKTVAAFKANAFLFQFVVLYEEYFGTKAMTINVHLLLHLCKAALDHGPLWASNCFPYEGENRNLLNFLQSPAAVAEQITRKFICKINSSILCDKYRVSEEVRTFCESLGARKLKYFRRSGDCVLPGAGSQAALCPEEQDALQQLNLPVVESVTCFSRIFHNGIRLTTCDYCKGLKIDDSCIVLCDGSKGQIHKICVPNASNTAILLVRIFVENSNPVISYDDIKYSDVTEVVADGMLKAVKIEDVVGQCLLMEVDGKKYVTVIPFGCYGD